ncbi:MAG: hypothetical protein QME46_09510 [Thermoanaerobacteraceae bacterium]|nr:hypothetical protein [Thermoanaerobacteraceae bacterium]
MNDNEKPIENTDSQTALPNNINLQDLMASVQKILEDPEKQQLLFVLKKIMDTTVNENNDPRVNLLNAIKPFLKPKRQKTVDAFKQYYTYMNVLKAQEELNKLNKQEGGESGLQHL